jgi:CheY-like chemotaxis protein
MKKRILAIDDDPVVLRYIENILSDHGYEIHKAADGTEALEMLDSVRPDLITLDLQMPEQWGPRFYRRMMQIEAYRSIPVIVISGLSGSSYSIPKAAGYLSKPFEPEVLVEKVQALIGQKSTSST